MDYIGLSAQVAEVVARNKKNKGNSRVEMHTETAPALTSIGGVKITRNDKLPPGECHIVDAKSGKLGTLLAVPMPPAPAPLPESEPAAVDGGGDEV